MMPTAQASEARPAWITRARFPVKEPFSGAIAAGAGLVVLLVGPTIVFVLLRAVVPVEHVLRAVRGWYQLRLPVHPGRVNTWRVLSTNIGVAVPMLGLPFVAFSCVLRVLGDVIVVGLLAVNGLLVGIALAAYGWPLAAALALHGPCELVAYSLAAGVYLDARRNGPSPRRSLIASAIVLAVLALGAVVEAHTGR